MAFSKFPSFKDQPATTPMAEFTMRVTVVWTNSIWEIVSIRSVGTCMAIAGRLVLTAKHVMDECIQACKKDYFEVWIIQLLSWWEIYAIWTIEDFWASSEQDMAIIQLSPVNEEASLHKNWQCVWMDVIPPPVWSRIVGFGYHNGKWTVTRNDQGGIDIKFNDKGSATVWEVKEIHEPRRDRNMNYPCFQISARTELGMSGWPVLNDKWRVCGIIASGLHFDAISEEDPISYASTLWPMMGIYIKPKSIHGVPQNDPISILDLAKRGIISVNNWERVKIDLRASVISVDKYLNSNEYGQE